MGCFGYICKGCGTSIRGNHFTGGEKCVMIHVRHGKEMGRVEGHYDEYGRVVEQDGISEMDRFRGDSDSINGHKEICCSEFDLEDSYEVVRELKVYKGRNVGYYDYVGFIIKEEVLSNIQNIRNSKLYKYLSEKSKKEIEDAYNEGKFDKATVLFAVGLKDLRYDTKCEIFENFKQLPDVKLEKYSGVVAWHSACYNKATDDEKNDLTPSESDPNQSWGKVRNKYI